MPFKIRHLKTILPLFDILPTTIHQPENPTCRHSLIAVRWKQTVVDAKSVDDDRNVLFTDHLLQPSHVRNVWILSAGITKPLRHTSQRWGNTAGAEKGLLITSPLSYLSHKPLAVISERVLRDAGNNRAGNSPSPPTPKPKQINMLTN